MDVQYFEDYFSGRLPLTETILITAIGIIVSFIIITIIKLLLKKRAGKGVISQEILGSFGEPDDTPYIDDSFPVPHGNPAIYFWERFRDGFMRMWFYNTITVIRLKKTGKVDHRAYLVKPVQQNTVNWDNCTYNVKNLFPVRRNFFMVVNEGCSEPLGIVMK